MKAQSQPREWCVGSDFIAVCRQNERRGRLDHFNSWELKEFSEFIELMDLTDLPVLGKKCMRFISDGVLMSRLDKILIL